MGRVTLKVTIKAEANQERQHVVRIRITKDRQPRYWPLSVSVPKASFNPAGSAKLRNWVRNHPEAGLLNARIYEQYRKADAVVAEFEKEGKPPFTADEVVAYLKAGGKPDLLTDYVAAHLVARKKLAGSSLQKLRTLRQYKQMAAKLAEWLGRTKRLKLPVRGLTKAIVLEYQSWLAESYAPNTVSLNLTCLRYIVRQAMDEGLIGYDRYPFRGIILSVRRKTVERLREADIDKLAEGLRRETRPGRRVVTGREHARPSALLMYYLQGIRLGDFVQLRRENYTVSTSDTGEEQHRIRYKTGKSQKEMNVLLPPEAVELLAPYLNHPDGTPKKPRQLLMPYLIDTIDRLTPEEQVLYIARATARLYAQIKTLGADLGLGKKITPHIMRHSFADLLRRNKEDLLTVQMTLGHSDPRTSRDYMESMDQGAVDSVVRHYGRKTVGKQPGQMGAGMPGLSLDPEGE
ncbi:MAG: hypothetical protein JWP57_830 [Spirosoma sp.]|nr:hypothetical protein [Spirosoma sp.]